MYDYMKQVPGRHGQSKGGFTQRKPERSSHLQALSFARGGAAFWRQNRTEGALAVQRLAMNPAGGADEQRENLGKETVSAYINPASVSDVMIPQIPQQRDWVRKYHDSLYEREREVDTCLQNLEAAGHQLDQLRSNREDASAAFTAADQKFDVFSEEDTITPWARALEDLNTANTAVEQAENDKDGYEREKGRLVASASRDARNAILSAANIASDLYVIHQVRDETAAAETAPVLGGNIRAGKSGQEKIDAIRHSAAQIFNIIDPVHGPVSKMKIRTDIPVFKESVKFKQAESEGNYQRNAPGKGKKLARLQKAGAAAGDANLSKRAKRVAKLYVEAGDISNEARLYAANAQKIMAEIGEKAKLNAGHDSDPGYKVQIKSTALRGSKHGPAVAEIDQVGLNGGNESVRARTWSQINDPLGRIPKKLHPLIYDGITAAMAEGAAGDFNKYVKMTRGAGSHAEVYAANKALIQGGYADAAQASAELYGRIVRTPKNMAEGGAASGQEGVSLFAQCPHCESILQGVTGSIYKDYRAGCEAFLIGAMGTYAASIGEKSIKACAERILRIQTWGAAGVRAEIIRMMSEACQADCDTITKQLIDEIPRKDLRANPLFVEVFFNNVVACPSVRGSAGRLPAVVAQLAGLADWNEGTITPLIQGLIQPWYGAMDANAAAVGLAGDREQFRGWMALNYHRPLPGSPHL